MKIWENKSQNKDFSLSFLLLCFCFLHSHVALEATGTPHTADCSWEHEPASPEVGQNCASAWNGVVWGSDLGSAEASTGLFPCRMEGDGTLETQGFTSTEMKLRHHLLSMLGAGASGNPVPMVPQELYFHRRKAGTQRTSH